MCRIAFAGLAAALLALGGCGDTTGKQALLGAGAGAAGAAILDEDIATGAVVGAAGNMLYCSQYPDRCRR